MSAKAKATLAEQVALRERVEEIEKDLKAKAAEAEKAEAEKEAAEKAAAAEALRPLAAEAKAEAAAMFAAEKEADEAQLSLGRTLLKVEKVLSRFPVLGLTIGRWAEKEIPDAAGPVWGSSRAYRGLLAARVASAVGPVGASSVDALQPVHAYLKEQDQGAVKAAFQAAKAKAPRGKSPSRSQVEAALKEAFPNGPGAAKPGPKKGSGRASASKKKAEKEQAEAVLIAEAVLAAAEAEAPEPKQPVVKAALSDLGLILKAHTDRYGTEAYQPGREIVRATVVWVASHGIPAAEAAMRVWAEAEKEAPEAPEAPEAEKAPEQQPEQRAARPRRPRKAAEAKAPEAAKAARPRRPRKAA